MTRRPHNDVPVTDESPTVWLGRHGHGRHRGGWDFSEAPTQVLDKIRGGGSAYYRHVNRVGMPMGAAGGAYYRYVPPPGAVLPRDAQSAAHYRYADVADQAESAAKSMYRAGVLLALGTVMSAVLGAGYWVLAARTATPTVVGKATALVSAMTALSLLGQLNLGPVLGAFLPRAGRERSRMVRSSYLTAFGVSAALGGAFALVAPRVDDAFDPLGSHWAAAGFAASVGVWSLFALQDFVLPSMQRATWVPFENLGYNAVKVAMLVSLGGATAASIFTAWVVPAGLAVVLVSAVLFSRVLPSRLPPAGDTGMESFRRFLAGESVAMVFDQIGVTFLPIIVVVTLGPAVGGGFGIAWMCAQMLDNVSYSLGGSLMIEGSRPGADVHNLHRALRRRVLIGIGGLVALAELGAPLFLRVFGASYAHSMTTVLRLLLLGTLARSIVILAICAARGQRRLRWIVLVHLSEALTVPAGAVVLGHLYGAVGVGLAWAASQGLIAAVILAQERRPAGIPAPTGHRGNTPAHGFDPERTVLIPGAARRRRMPTAGAGARRTTQPPPAPPDHRTDRHDRYDRHGDRRGGHPHDRPHPTRTASRHPAA